MKTLRRTFAVTLTAILLVLWVASASATTAENIAHAKQYYKDGMFAEVIDLLTQPASDTTLSKAEAMEAYLLLAKASAAKGFNEQAVVYMHKVLELDPSFRLNTKVEPPQVQRVWFAVDSIKGVEDAASKTQTVAVFYFENNSVADREAMDGLSKGLAAMLVTDLAQVPGLRIVERERIQYILDELKMQKTEYFDQSASVKIGKLLGAHRLLLGSFSKIDKTKMRIDVRLVKTETSEIISADKVEGKPSQLAKLQNDLTSMVVKWLGVKLAEKPADGGQPLEAVLAYTRGLNFEDEMQLTQAYEAYKQALAAYPQLNAARDRMQALEPFLAGSGG
jgi:curli biogenesis system outer membrane secretion channel CsgG